MSDTQTLEIESELGKNFYQLTLQRLAQANVAEETRNDIAEFIVVLVSNNRSPQDIVQELSSISGEAISEDFVHSLFQDLNNLKNGQNNAAPAAGPAVHANVGPQAFNPSSLPFTPSANNNNSGTDFNGAVGNNGFSNNNGNSFSSDNRPRYPKNFAGVRKNTFNRKPQSGGFNPANPLQLQKALADLLAGKDPTKRKMRCRKFPHCPHKDCKFAHPTRNCFQYPNCPNPPGTCNYLHPGEDDELINEIAKTRAENEQRRLENQQKIDQQNGIGICHKGANCYLSTCKYAHPTKANESAEINVFEWCPSGTGCADPNCHRAHPSYKTREEVHPNGPPNNHNNNNNGYNNHRSDFRSGNKSALNKIAQLASVMQAPQQEERSLEQCKFGSRCLNPRCKFRHASTPVLCRDGANCTRIDCYFSHPLAQDCKYLINCKNKFCLFKHPPERDVNLGKPLVWTANSGNGDNGSNDNGNNGQSDGQSGNTKERQFAVPNDEVLEKAPAQEDASMSV